jgi:hypothetical protein
MQFIDRHPLYRIIQITGPTHNLLGLQISSAPMMGEPQLEALDDDAGGLNGREVAAQVMLGIAQSCAELQTTYHIEKIEYVSADSPPVEVYRGLAIELMRRIASSVNRRS